MKTTISLFFILLMPFFAFAHPGKTDSRGGHKCWKNCDTWELQREEYHLHDKDGQPIRLDANRNVLQTVQTKDVSTPKIRFRHEDSAASSVKSGAKVRKSSEGKGVAQRDVAGKHDTVTVYEESILPVNAILLILLAFLMLVILILLRKNRSKEECR